MPSAQGDKIEELLRRKGKTPNWLADQIGVSRQVVYHWIGGARPRTKHSAWKKAAEVLGVDLRILEDDSAALPPEEQAITLLSNTALSKPLRAAVQGDRAILPVWRGVMTGTQDECYFVEPNSPEFIELPAFLIHGDPSSHVVCIPHGRSMYPRIQQGWRVVVKLDSNPPPGTLVVAEDPDRRRYIKIYRAGKKDELHPVNEAEYCPIKDVTGWAFLGSVIAIWSPPEPGKANIEFNDGLPIRA